MASINSELLDSALSLTRLTHFYVGLTNEWLETMAALMTSSHQQHKPVKDAFPILVGGACEMYSLSKLFKTLSAGMPATRVKILKMSAAATGKQFLGTLIANSK